MEATNQDFKTDLRDLYITSAQQIDVTPSKNAIIIHVPYRLLKGFQKIQQRLVRELEKKFSGKDVVLVANRRIMPKTKSGSSKARPRSRTLTSVSWTKEMLNCNANCIVLPPAASPQHLMQSHTQSVSCHTGHSAPFYPLPTDSHAVPAQNALLKCACQDASAALL